MTVEPFRAISLSRLAHQLKSEGRSIIHMEFGQPSTGALLNVQGIMKNRGRWFPYQTGTREIRAMPMLHPAYLLRSPIGKRLAWRDLLAIKKALG